MAAAYINQGPVKSDRINDALLTRPHGSNY
jgi:hypothetical protein